MDAPSTVDASGRSGSIGLNEFPGWALAVVGSFICLLLYLPTATWDYAQVTDNIATTVGSWSIADHGSIRIDTSWPDVPWAEQGPDGNWYIWRNPGGMVWGALFYLPTDLTFEPTRAIEVPMAPGTLGAVVATALGVGVMILVFRGLGSATQALFAGLALGLGTSNWSVSADSAWNHGPTLLFLSLGLLLSSRERWASSGLAWAAAIAVRPHVAVAAAVVGLAEAWRRRKPSIVIIVGVLSGLGLLVTIWFYATFFGEATMRPGQLDSFITGDVSNTSLGFFGNLFYFMFHPQRGLFIFSPFLLLLLPAIPAGWRAAPTWARAGAVAAVLYSIIQVRADVFYAGKDFFGYRGPLETVTLAAPLLFLAYREWAPTRHLWRRAVHVTTAAAVGVFALGVTVLDPIRELPAHCLVEAQVGVYRSEEDKAAGRERERECFETANSIPGSG